MSVIIKSGNSSNTATINSYGAVLNTMVDANGNTVARSQREQLPSNQEALLVAGKNDDIATILRTDRKGNLLIGNYLPEIFDNFEGTTLNAAKWTTTITNFTAAQTTANGYRLNTSTNIASGSVSILQSFRTIYKYQRIPLNFKCRLRHAIIANSVGDFGFGTPAGTTAILTNGVHFRISTSGIIQAVISNNSTETVASVISRVASNGNTIGGVLNMSDSYYTTGYFVYDIIIDDDNAVFTVQDTSTGELLGTVSIQVPTTYTKMVGATALAIYARVWNSSTPTATPILDVVDIQVNMLDINISLDAGQVAGTLGLSSDRHPQTGAQLANFTNSAAPISATLSNTAAGYTTLGGKFQFAAIAGATTDYALFAYTVPTSAKFLCEGVTIDTYNTGAAVATTATVLEWGIGFNAGAVALTSAYTKIALGVQSFQIGAAIGTQANTINQNFSTPFAVESARFLAIILNMPIATATVSQVIRGVVNIRGRFI